MEPTKKKEPEKEEEEPDEEEEDEGKETIVTKAVAAAERLEKATEAMSKQLDRQEKVMAEAALGGTADAGQQAQTPEQKKAESAKKLMEGSGMDPFADEGKAALEEKEKSL